MQHQKLNTESLEKKFSILDPQYRTKFFITIGILVVSFIVRIFAPYSIIIFIAIATVIASVIHAYDDYKRKRLEKFTAQNGLSYTHRTKTLNLLNGSVLGDRGKNKFISPVISGRKDGRAFYFFTYNYEVGSGKNKTRVTNYGFRTDLGKNFVHHIFLDDKESAWKASLNHDHNAYKGYSKKNILKTNTIFDDAYTVYSPPGYGAATLKILSPEIMETIKDLPITVDIEITGSVLFVYLKDSPFKNPESIELTMTLVDTIYERIKWAARHTDRDDIKHLRETYSPRMDKPWAATRKALNIKQLAS